MSTSVKEIDEVVLVVGETKNITQNPMPRGLSKYF